MEGRFIFLLGLWRGSGERAPRLARSPRPQETAPLLPEQGGLAPKGKGGHSSFLSPTPPRPTKTKTKTGRRGGWLPVAAADTAALSFPPSHNKSEKGGGGEGEAPLATIRTRT